MKFTLTIFCMFAYATSALAQYGVTNVRDRYGNLVRDTGMNPVRGQGPVSNLNAPPPTMNAPVQKPAINSRQIKGTNR